MKFRRRDFGRVSHRQSITFTFDGKKYSGYEGETLASALLANGVHLVGRSFKYHRPRGIMSAGAEESNALVTVDRGQGRVISNVRATTTEIYEGFSAFSQHNWPSLKYDLGAIVQTFASFFPAGFYNKTFMWPRSFWERLYEPAIRRMAGLGPAPKHPDPDSYASNYSHCETLIIGAGPAGIAAALNCLESGERVVLVDENPEMGGSLLTTLDTTIDGLPAIDWLDRALTTLQEAPNVRLLTRTTAIGYYHDNFLGLVERLQDHMAEPDTSKPRELLHRVRASNVILATGAIERPMAFENNDRPGIMLASAALAYLHRYGVTVGQNIAIFTSHNSAYEVAFELDRAGICVKTIVDTRTEIPGYIRDLASSKGIAVIEGATVTKAFGKKRVSSIRIHSLVNDVSNETVQTIKCDALLMSNGWTPSVHLFSHSKGSLRWDTEIAAYVPDSPNENTKCIGACNGTFDLNACLSDGSKAAGTDKNYECTLPYDIDWQGQTVEELASEGTRETGYAFVDFQNDVSTKDIKLAVREGFESIEHIKRYTTNGMATDQGKTSNLNALQIAAVAVHKPVHEVGLTTFRPPYTPTTFGAIAGYHANDTFHVTRKTPIDAWAEANSAVFEPVALWRRARYFPNGDEDMGAAVARECKATRESLGIFDASTLGKIEVVGPDAAEFMNRMYTNPWAKLGTGRCRYGLMLREDGFIFDDGVVGRLDDDRFHVTTTTGGAPRVLAMMEDYLQTEFPALDVWLTSTTEQWAVIALNGPNARKLIEPLVEDIDLSPEAFPHMAVREGRICGVETRLFRVSFTGELGFEINVPAAYGKALWELLLELGQAYQITPYGTETMHVLRAEKGYIIVGQDTDGTVTPYDAGMGWAVGKNKTDFVGKRSLARPDIVANGRKHLVGLLTSDPEIILEEGAQIVARPDEKIPMKMIGHVTSSYWSNNLGRSIGAITWVALLPSPLSKAAKRSWVNTYIFLCLTKFMKPR